MDGLHTHLRLLFVEDQPDDIDLERRQLEREGLSFDWSAAASEGELRKALADFRPDVVLCDYSIPGFSGKQALHIVKEQSPYTPFIFVSGTIGEETAVACLQEGATDYLLKGSLRRLGAAVKRALSEVEERRHVREIEEARLRLAEILEATPDLVAMTDPDCRITYVNEAGCRLLGVTREQALRRPPDVFYAPWARELVRAVAIPQVLAEGSWVGETALMTSDGVEIPLSQVILAHNGADGGARFFSTVARDIRDRKAYESRIRHLANFDALTELPNRTLFGDRVTQALIHARRAGGHLALLTINIDGFRLVNDGFGHAIGDHVLKEVAARVRATVREGDTVACAGVDEFGVLLADLARLEDIEPVARKILDALALPYTVGEHEVRLTASAGVAVYPTDGDDLETLLRNAGAALHRTKLAERGGVQFCSSELARESRERIEIQTRLSSAMRGGELSLYFQVQRDLRGDRPGGVEALMRWIGSDGRFVPPASFIPVAEETGLIKGLGEWALLKACTSALPWVCTEGPQFRLGVNVSPLQLREPGFVELVARVLRSTSFPAENLELEITEGALMSAEAATTDRLARLKSLGVKIAIDDFGTGYSSLSYLSRLPIDRLKIDQSFVHRMTVDSRDAAIVKSVISLGHGLGIEVIAEGVENEDQLRALLAMDCDQAQGFLFSAPIPGERMPMLLAARSSVV